MRIEVFYSPFCACSDELRRRKTFPSDPVFRDITRNLDEAVRLGIRQSPALVVDGRLHAQGPETLHALDRLQTTPARQS